MGRTALSNARLSFAMDRRGGASPETLTVEYLVNGGEWQSTGIGYSYDGAPATPGNVIDTLLNDGAVGDWAVLEIDFGQAFENATSAAIRLSVGEGSTELISGTRGLHIDNMQLTQGAANSSPIAVSDDIETDEDTAISIAVLANDSDPEGDTLILTPSLSQRMAWSRTTAMAPSRIRQIRATSGVTASPTT